MSNVIDLIPLIREGMMCDAIEAMLLRKGGVPLRPELEGRGNARVITLPTAEKVQGTRLNGESSH